MLRFSPIRVLLALAGLALLTTSPVLAAPSRQQGAQPPASIERRSHPSAPRPDKANSEHLAEWMSRHSNLTPEQQQAALAAEPGFRQYPPQTQKRLLEMLAQLNAMPPEKRQRLLERNEWMERLTLPQREQVRAATKQLAELPPDQRRYVDRTFRGLRELPPAQREAVLNSDRFSHLTDAQRATLNSLMRIEPLLPPPYDSYAPPAR